jgi:hypothetical protein
LEGKVLTVTFWNANFLLDNSKVRRDLHRLTAINNSGNKTASVVGAIIFEMATT